MILGKYGALPGEKDKEVVKMCTAHGEKIIDCRPADLIEDEMMQLTEQVKNDGFYEKQEDVLSYALFPEVATNYFKWRYAKNSGVDKDMAASSDKVYPV